MLPLEQEISQLFCILEHYVVGNLSWEETKSTASTK